MKKSKEISFKNNDVATLSFHENGVNINPAYIEKWGSIKISVVNGNINIQPEDFKFDCKNSINGLKF